jgi:hypothetical protein
MSALPLKAELILEPTRQRGLNGTIRTGGGRLSPGQVHEPRTPAAVFQVARRNSGRKEKAPRGRVIVSWRNHAAFSRGGDVALTVK